MIRQFVTVFTALAVIGTLLIITASAAARADHSRIDSVDDSSLIVAYRKGTNSKIKVSTESAVGGKRVKKLKTGAHVVKVKPGEAQVAIASLRARPEVRYAEPNYKIRSTAQPNDPLYVNQWALENTWHTEMDVDAPGAWDITKGSSSIVVGVIDTGIDYSHPDLAANVWSNPGDIGGCGAGTHGYDFSSGDCDPMDESFNSHGTADSGVIGAVGDNGVGIAGINWRSKIIGLKIFDSSGVGMLSAGISAIDWAIRAKQAGVNIRVLSNSWGYTGAPSQALLDMVNLAGANGIFFAAAAGNDGASIDTNGFYPCALNAANEICVGATNSLDQMTSFSNRGQKVDLAAPGYTVQSTAIGGGYIYLSGTSLATPFVAGAAALLLSNEDMTPAAVKNRITSTVDVIPGLAGLVRTSGRLNIGRAVAGGGVPAPTPTPTPTPPPGATPTPTPTATTAPTPTPTPDPNATPTPPPAETPAPTPTPTSAPTPTPTPAPSIAPSKPGTPTLSVALAPQAAESSIRLSWTAPPDGGSPITGYRIYRGTRAGSEKLITSVGNGEGYEDTTALPAIKYFYRTSALNAAGEGPKSNTVSAIIPTAPTAPRSLKVAIVSTGGLKLTWSPPSKAGTSPITGYWIWRGDAAGGEAQLIQVGTARSYVDLTTTAGVKAWYVVTAINAVGESPASNEVGATPTK